MPPLDLELANEATRDAHAKLGRRLPAGYPADPVAERRAAPMGTRSWAPVIAVAEAAEAALVAAVQAEADARAAQELAVRGLRHLGHVSPAWPRIGELVGMSQQGAHRRYAAIAAMPRAVLTIDDELDRAE